MLDTAELHLQRTDELRHAWNEMRRTRPGIRQREAADQLGVSEGELLASRVGRDVIALRPEWPRLLRELGALGPVKTITRNVQAVHETVGVWDHVSFVGSVGLVQGAGLDLRLLLDRWAIGFLVRDRTATGSRTSLQFYDRHGEAVHKVYPESATEPAFLLELQARYTTSDAGPARFEPRPPGSAPAPEATAVVREALLADWAALADTHDFGPMLARHGVARAAALDLARGAFTSRFPVSALAGFLRMVAASGVPLMVFVGNAGAVQIRTGPISTVKRIGPWLNILEDDFNLHLLDAELASAWIVEKPTADGMVTSVEAYAEDGSEAVVFYGARKPGKPELSSWRDLVGGLRREALA